MWTLGYFYCGSSDVTDDVIKQCIVQQEDGDETLRGDMEGLKPASVGLILILSGVVFN